MPGQRVKQCAARGREGGGRQHCMDRSPAQSRTAQEDSDGNSELLADSEARVHCTPDERVTKGHLDRLDDNNDCLTKAFQADHVSRGPHVPAHQQTRGCHRPEKVETIEREINPHFNLIGSRAF
jgi:hypothetical protein